MQKTEILGNEYDQVLRRAIGATLRELGVTEVDEDWELGGSQEISTWHVIVGNAPVTIEAETYMGLSISGDAEVVDMLVARVRDRVTAHSG
jgi:hypothetical protein